MAVSFVAILVIALGYGTFPWIALALATSFGLYGYVKKYIGPQVDAISGLSLETGILTPVAIVILAVVAGTTGIVTGTAGASQLVLMLLSGFATAMPLLFFAAAARRVPLVHLGLTQYVAPISQFLVGVALLHEEMPPERWIGFALVWLALMLLIIDAVRSGDRPTRTVTGEPKD